MHNTSAAQAALKAACLSATLVTAFAASAPSASATAAQTPTSFQSSDGVNVQNGYVIEYGSYFGNTTPSGTVDDPDTMFQQDEPFGVVGSQAADPPGPYSVVVFTQSPTSLAGVDFDSTFLSGTAYTEQEVADEIASGFTDTNATDQDAYNTFVGTLSDTYNTANNASDPINAYEFTNGQSIGTVSAAQLSHTSYTNTITSTPTTQNAASPYFGFGLTPSATAVPEAGSLPLLLAGLLPLGWVAARRRKAQE